MKLITTEDIDLILKTAKTFGRSPAGLESKIFVVLTVMEELGPQMFVTVQTLIQSFSKIKNLPNNHPDFAIFESEVYELLKALYYDTKPINGECYTQDDITSYYLMKRIYIYDSLFQELKLLYNQNLPHNIVQLFTTNKLMG